MKPNVNIITKINSWLDTKSHTCKEYIEIFDTELRRKAADIFANRINTKTVGPNYTCKKITINTKHNDEINKMRIENLLVNILSDIVYGLKNTDNSQHKIISGIKNNPQLNTLHSTITVVPVGTNEVLVEFCYLLTTRKNKNNNKCYLIGAISDNPNAEEQFTIKEKELADFGYDVYNPFRENQILIDKHGLRTKKENQEKYIRRIVMKNIINLAKCNYYAYANNIDSDGANIDKQLCAYLKLIEIK